MKDKTRDASLDPALGRAVRRALQEGSAECPDAETLAAWSENGLLPTLRREVDAHLATCNRCQAQLAAIARSAGAMSPQPARESRKLMWRWLMPAAAGATALAVWVAVQPGSHRSGEDSPSTASNAKLQAPPPAADAPVARFEAQPNAPRERVIPSRPAAPATAAPPVSPNAQQRAEEDRAAPKSTAETVGAEEGAKREAYARSAPLAAAPAAAPQKPVKATADAAGSLEIVSSDPSVRWRISGVDVEHTIDGGVTWARQSTGSTAALTAGASPSPDVCWVVGRAGTVLRSTDGRHWQKIPFPEAADLTEVQSAGPAQATVMTGDARRFTTTDGGATWAIVPLQEF